MKQRYCGRCWMIEDSKLDAVTSLSIGEEPVLARGQIFVLPTSTPGVLTLMIGFRG